MANDKKPFSVHLKDGTVLQSQPETLEDIGELYKCLDEDLARMKFVESGGKRVFMVPASNINYMEVSLEDEDSK